MGQFMRVVHHLISVKTSQIWWRFGQAPSGGTGKLVLELNFIVISLPFQTGNYVEDNLNEVMLRFSTWLYSAGDL